MDIYDPYARFDSSNEIHPTAVIYPNVRLGKNNKIGAYSVIGSDGEIRNSDKFEGFVTIGDGNVISEHVTIQRPQDKSKFTAVGDNNIIMAHTHIGHDAKVCSNCEISTGTIIGGYALIKDGAKLKIGVTVRNRITIEKDVIVGMGSVVVKDISEGLTVVGNPARKIK